METCLDYIDREKAIFSTDEQKWHRRVRKWKEEFPDKVTIKIEPEDNDGNMVAVIPTNWFKIQPKKPRVYSDEQLAMMRERAANLKNKPRKK